MTHVQDLMTTAVVTVPPDLDTGAARYLMRHKRIHHLIVVDGGRIAGVLSQRDLGGTRAESLPAGRVDAVMRSGVVAIAPEATLRAAAEKLRGYDIGCLPVVDGKRLVGIITVSDLLTWIATRTPAPERRRVRAQRPRRAAV